ncbi:MAG: hypothetical protein QXN36_00705 [Candidatus Bathyarchaeia archaeon]
MTAEDKVTECLAKYGIVREADVIAYCVAAGYTERAVKTAIQKMEKQKKIYRVVHDRLKPVGVYFRLKEQAETEEKRSAEAFMLPNPNLNERERKLYCLDVDFLNLVKELDNEWYQEELERFNLKYGVTQKKGS